MNQIDIKSRLYDYSVLFTDDFEKNLEAMDEHKVFVIDRNVYRLYEEKFASVKKEDVFFMEAVESKKNMDTVMEILTFLQQRKVKKNWKIVCFGGGITQDVTTIAANLFLRNVEWVFFPTTLLAMCDSCIGGKCGINFNGFKNQIGVFYPPKEIIIDTRFINTLTEADYLNGWGELLKFSLTKDNGFYEKITEEKSFIPCPNIEEYIYRGLCVKKEIIEEDEFESDLRRVLNYGHTFGHALESYTDNAIPHGQAVIWGIDVVNYISWREGFVDKEYYLEIKKLIKEKLLTKEIEIKTPQKLFDIIKTDKKVKNNTIYLALLNSRSSLFIYPKEIDGSFEELFESYIKETHDYYND